MIKICQQCKKEFKTYQSSRKYCSRECSSNSVNKRRIIKCLYCGKEKSILNYLTQVFCSRECCVKYNNENVDSPYKSKQIVTRKNVNCDYCGKEYELHNYRFKTKSGNHFCSSDCFNNYRRTEIICESCGKHFIRPNWENRRFCSDACARKTLKISNFENTVLNLLKKEYPDVIYEHELTFQLEKRKIYVDFFIESQNLVIECFGNYWHCFPGTYDKSYFHTLKRKTAKEIWEDDEKRISILKKNGYRVIIIWEEVFLKKELDIKFIKEIIENEIFKNKENTELRVGADISSDCEK